MFTCSNTKTEYLSIQNINRILMCRETHSVTADQMFSIAAWARLSALCSVVLTKLHPKVIFRGNEPAEDRTGPGSALTPCDRKVPELFKVFYTTF